MAITTQEGVDGYREKAMKIANVEQVGLGNIMELSVTGHVLKCARRSKLSGGASPSNADGWNLKDHRHLTVARRLREKARGSCSAVLNELVKIIRESMLKNEVWWFLVLNRESIVTTCSTDLQSKSRVTW